MKSKIIVGFSGGVDSFYAALLLKKDFEVHPVFLKLLSTDKETKAKEAAEIIGLKLSIIDISKEFKETVIKYFIEYYSKGLTPNPCVICNQKIKLKKLYEIAKEMGISLISTGHYAKVDFIKEFSRKLIIRGEDRSKEQSYFLSLIDPKIIQRLILPLGTMKKSKVIELAKSKGYPFKFESQDICFIDTTYYEFLKRYIKTRPGDIVLKDGTVIGKHSGILRYTIGQRKGLGVSYNKPLYVIGINPKENKVIVGFKEDLYKEEIFIWKTVWHVPFHSIRNFDNIHAQIRYRAKPVPVRKIEHLKKDIYRVELRHKVEAPAPGQICAVYFGNVLLGGGEITSKI